MKVGVGKRPGGFVYGHGGMLRSSISPLRRSISPLGRSISPVVGSSRYKRRQGAKNTTIISMGAWAVRAVSSDDGFGVENFVSGNSEPPPPLPPEAAGTKLCVGSLLYVGNLPRSVKNKQLAEFFQDVENVDHIEVMHDPETQNSSGFAFVTMRSLKDSERPIASLDGSKLDSRPVQVSFPNTMDLEKGFEQDVVKDCRFGDFASSPPLSPGVGTKKLYVRNLPRSVRSGDLGDLFEDVGNVDPALVEVSFDIEANKSRGVGLVTLKTVADCQRAIETLDGYDLDGRVVKVNFASPVDLELAARLF